MNLKTICESLICLDYSIFSKCFIFFIFVLGYQSANLFSYKDSNSNTILKSDELSIYSNVINEISTNINTFDDEESNKLAMKIRYDSDLSSEIISK